jgi:hypothetical protein
MGTCSSVYTTRYFQELKNIFEDFKITRIYFFQNVNNQEIEVYVVYSKL